MAETTYLFIDGNYLQERARSVCATWFNREPDFDYAVLGHSFTKIFYYDSLPAQRQSEPEPAFQRRRKEKLDFFDRLLGINGWHVNEGVSRSRKGGSATQKEVDVLIAVDMLTHTHRKNMDRLTFIAGDQDFRPLLDAVVRDGMYVTLWYHRESISSDLRNTADTRMEIGLYWFHSMMTVDFKIANPLPHVSGSGGEQRPSNGILQEVGYRGNDLVARFWKSSNDPNYMACSTIPVNGQNYMQLTHQHDPLYLKRVYAELYGDVDWQPNP